MTAAGAWPRGTATLSADRTYRYLLTRRWDDGPVMTWIMLNPSTADADTDDPTIRRCTGFARREGCGAICVVNLFALRATDPRELRTSPDPVGPDNDSFLLERTRAGSVVAAWGSHGSLNGRSRAVAALLVAAEVPLLALGVTSSGEPRHPLYIRSDAPFTAWPVPALIPIAAEPPGRGHSRRWDQGSPLSPAFHHPGPQRAFHGAATGQGRLPSDDQEVTDE